MFGRKVERELPGLSRLQKDIARDRLRLQQRLGLDIDRPVEEPPRSGAPGRLYQVFVSMGEA